MKRVLYFAFFFPPLGGAGVQRTLKFVRYLPEFGWRATVMTARAHYWMQDPTLLAEVEADTEVRRVPFPGARFLTGTGAGGARSHARIRFLRRMARLVLVPDAYRAWAWAARRAAGHELQSGTFDAILTTSSPDSAHWIGRSLRRAFGLPWVADFRDPWTRRLSYAPPTRLHDSWQRRLERSCVLEADRLVVTCEETRDDFLSRYPELRPEHVVVIPNGYDAEDFRSAERQRQNPPDWIPAEGFDLLHAGQLNPERPSDPFFAGLRRFFDHHPDQVGRRRVWFVGGHYDRDVEAARRFSVADAVVFAPSCPHLESVTALLSARALLLLEHNSDRGRLILPGKFWEYAYARRPILAMVPRGGAADRWVRSLEAGIWADPDDPGRAAEALARIWERPNPVISEATLAPFERRELTRGLAALLDSVSA